MSRRPDRGTLRRTRSSRHDLKRLLKAAAVALLPPFIGFAGEVLIFAALGSRWLLMVAAVIVSAANGGLATGLVSTILSAALAWWYLIPPVRTFGAASPGYYFSLGLFVAIGVAISLLHERLRRTNDGLAHAARQNHIFAAFLENSLDFIGIADPDGKPVYLNPAGRRMVELPDSVDITSTEILEYYPPDQRTLAKNVILAEMTAAGKWAGETCFRNWRTGASIPVLDTHFLIRDPAGRRVIGMGTVTRDISVQKTQRDELEQANRRLAQTMSDLRAAQHVAHVGSWSWDARTGKTEWSEELYRIFGLRPEQRPPTPIYLDPGTNILSEETKAAVRAAIEKTLADGSPYEIDLEFSRDDDSTGWVSARGEAVRDDAGRVVAIHGTCADITKIKELERLRDEWVSVIAHDLRQPIGAILMASQLLPELCENVPGRDGRTVIMRIQSAAESLRRMVGDLLDMSLLESNRLKLERKPTRPSELVTRTLDRLAHLPGIDRVHVRTDPDLPPIFVDPMRIEQVLGNVISNAAKYSDTGTDITIAVTRNAGEIDFAVTNHGRGIAPDELPRLFNRFTRSRATRGSRVMGLGLGLYIARGIVQAHGGSLRVASVPGETTTFTVGLPISMELRQAA